MRRQPKSSASGQGTHLARLPARLPGRHGMPLRHFGAAADMELGKDYVFIRNGPEADAGKLAVLTGKAEDLPSYLQSTTEAMYIHTDLSDSRIGFRFRYSRPALEAAN